TTVFSSFLSVGMRGQGLAWSACEAVGRLDQSVEDAGFVERVPGVVDDVEFGFRPGPVQVVGGTYRGAHVVAALDDHTGDVTDGLDPVDELVRGEKTPVVEVMVLDPGEGQGVVLVGVVFTQARIGQQGDRRTFPHAPGTSRFQPRPPVRCVETSSVGRDEVVAFLLGDRGQVVLPQVREEHGRTVLVEPADLLVPQGEDATQDQFCDPL